MSFWQNKRVLVTGANGFLGSALIRSLVDQETYVVSLAHHAPNDNSKGRADSGQIKEVIGSVTDFPLLGRLIEREKIEIVYHLAALPLVETGQSNPISTYEVNVGGTWNVLEAARQNQVAKVVVVSTAHVYGDNPHLPLTEDYYPQPSRPYETSKACADLIAQSYADTYDLSVEIPRFVNLYGPGDLNQTRIVPKVITTVLADQNPELWDEGAVRDFLFIDDAVTALKRVVERKTAAGKRNRIINFGTGEPVKITDLAKKIIKLADRPEIKLVVKETPADRVKEIRKQYVSIAKAAADLGWKPTIGLDEGLARTIDWYKVYGKG